MYRQIHNFRLITKLGKGGVGEVYLAEDIESENVFAVKLLLKEFLHDIKIVNDFIEEAKLHSELSHPNILKFHSFIRDENVCYIVMEYVEGKSVYDLIRSTKGIEEVRAIKIFKQIVSAISYLHSKGIIHRDINPRNILLTENDVVKISDFGISKKIDEFYFENEKELGTLYYMSPEQIVKSHIDERSDIYSLGMTLYEMLTGRLPFSISINDETDEKIKNEILFSKISDLRTYKNNISPNIANAIFKMIERKKENRFQNCSAILDFLEPKFINLELDESRFKKMKSISFHKNLDLGTDEKKYINDIQFTNDERIFSILNSNGEINFFDLETFEKKKNLFVNQSRKICFSKNGNYFAVSELGKEIKIFFNGSNTIKSLLKGHKTNIVQMQFSDDGNFLCSISNDGEIKIWNVVEDKEINSIQIEVPQNCIVKFCEFSNTNLIAIGFSDDTVKIFENNKIIKTISYKKNISSISIYENLFVIGFVDGEVKLFTTSNEDEIYSLQSHKERVNCLKFLNENYLISAGKDSHIKVWKLQSGVEIFSLTNNVQKEIVSLAISQNKKYIVNTDIYSSVFIWKIFYQ